eukprot:5730969-Pyramimonas_sp.AAC.1
MQQVFTASLEQLTLAEDAAFGDLCSTAQRLWTSIGQWGVSLDRLSATVRILGLTSRMLVDQKAFLATGSTPAIRGKPANDRALVTAFMVATTAFDGLEPAAEPLQQKVDAALTSAKALLQAQQEHDNTEALHQAQACYEKLVALMGKPLGEREVPWRRGLLGDASWKDLQSRADDKLF